MKTTKSILIFAQLLLCAFLCAGFSSAAPQASKVTTPASPDRLVANLYKQHKKRSPFFQTSSRALLDTYFERNLANLIWKDAVHSKGEVGAIDGDPLYNAQDTEIKHFSIHKPTFGKGQAEVVVSFENFGKKQQIVFVLVPRKNGWRIANLKYDDGTDLLGLLKGASTAVQTTRDVKIYLAALG
jgi:hypothetical protein